MSGRPSGAATGEQRECSPVWREMLASYGVNDVASLVFRDAELLRHLVTGSHTRRIAPRMFLSEDTVQDHLKSSFAKSGTRNRRTLLGRAAGL
ncbi:MAG: LuxR C-terminal-related transcriptional regulator [Actinomycetota bacterium]|nr:LuxR C-terminal-related transcriptional regulator [Actinomycetota bacterium]